MDPDKNKTELMSRQLKVQEEPDTPDNYNEEEDRDEGYAYTEERWVRRP